MINPYKSAVDEIFLLYRSRVQEAKLSVKEKEELVKIIGDCEDLYPDKPSKLRKLKKYQAALELFDKKYSEYAGPEALEELHEGVARISDVEFMGMSPGKFVKKVNSVFGRGKHGI